MLCPEEEKQLEGPSSSWQVTVIEFQMDIKNPRDTSWETLKNILLCNDPVHIALILNISFPLFLAQKEQMSS